MSDLITLKAAALRIGHPVTTLHHYVLVGKLSPVVRGCGFRNGKGDPSLYSVSDIDSLSLQRRARATRDKQQFWIHSGRRPCTKCGEVKPFTAFHCSRSGFNGHEACCKVCSKLIRMGMEHLIPHQKETTNV